jgi:predicted ribosomally synthesized peptide with SipW-like signal peptide
MTRDNQLYDLTRRKMLLGAGAVGLASAGAGFGTSAFFSDTERFEDNTITAGTLDLLVHYESAYNGAPAENLAPMPSGTADGPAELFYTLDDVKPGDSGSFQFCFELNTNPAYLWLCTEGTEDAENGQNDPEIATEGVDTDGLGELDDSILVDATYCDSDGVPLDGGEIVSGVTFAGLLAAFESGAPLNADGTDAEPGAQSPYAASTEPGVTTGPCVCFEWELPFEVGNEVQGDSMAFSVAFHAVQARHTDGTQNPCGEDVVPEEPPEAPPETDFEEGEEGWTLIGDSTTVEAQIVESGGNPGAYLEATDQVAGGVWYWNAPASFLGDQSAFAGGRLAYDLQQAPRSSQFVADDIVLEGAGTTLVYRYDSPADYPAESPAWSEYDIALDASAGWTVGTNAGPAATPTEIASVLGDLTSLRIRGEFRSGADTGGLDNPRFVAP